MHRFVRSLAPAIAFAFGTLASGCSINATVNDKEGVPLSELDRSGEPPIAIAMAGPDRVTISQGPDFGIEVSGDREAIEALRFSLDGEGLGISRFEGSDRNIGTALIRVTTPSISTIMVAGSGSVESPTLVGPANVIIAGSGEARISDIAAESLTLRITGSGSFDGTGSVNRLDLTIAGSGSGRMGGLRADRADILITGAGEAEFTSDGKVDAKIMGSGNVTVNGNPDCTVTTVGSGTLRCRSESSRVSRTVTSPEASAP